MSTPDPTDLRDVLDRATGAYRAVEKLAREQVVSNPLEALRLAGKADGIALVISYMHDALRIGGDR